MTEEAINLLSRRKFVATTASASAIALASSSLQGKPQSDKNTTAETLVQSLYKSLNDKQREAICLPFDHPLRSKVNNNWHINKTRLNQFSDDQQAMVREIFLKLHSPEYAQKVFDQVDGDSGFGKGSFALFGKPGSGKFEFVFTGRHCTRRCDGDSVEGAAFGGPIFYGHAAKGFYEKPEHPGNAYWFQAKRANELFQALDGKQRKIALLDKRSRGERGNKTIETKGTVKGLEGIPASDFSGDQKDLFRKVLADLLAPFRQQDSTEAMKLIEANDIDKLHLSYYKKENIGEDEVWDVWQVEGPKMVWYFRGKPHVHVWANIEA
ncbi:MAG: DUF3500 domain-containing protein [Opitutae bacterium]|nr:DUF3500 domain-containing protein [Opitutae bacterium]MBT4665724.1 DUF3500 domain-containing protein [Opitutae bacterium]MBT6850103.1 DUF3500 domain-containing protein [Opitutae bacterium]MBT7741848.1 DUF3500 domain-containing protein [Opitutae bacterium]MBT7923395.1 DUF3500 domain-containing protein [Opitutae bacterium]